MLLPPSRCLTLICLLGGRRCIADLVKLLAQILKAVFRQKHMRQSLLPLQNADTLQHPKQVLL